MAVGLTPTPTVVTTDCPKADAGASVSTAIAIAGSSTDANHLVHRHDELRSRKLRIPRPPNPAALNASDITVDPLWLIAFRP